MTTLIYLGFGVNTAFEPKHNIPVALFQENVTSTEKAISKLCKSTIFIKNVGTVLAYDD